MRYLSVLGPIPTDEGDAFTPVVLSDAAPPRMLSPASSLDGALFSARRALGATDDVLADDTLGHLAAQAGLRVGALPEPERLTLAAVAVAVNSHEGLTKVTDARLLHELLTSTVAFTRARPWRRFLNDLTLPGRATGPGGGDFECTVLGEGGEQHGLIAYDARGGHERFLELLDARTPGAAMRVDSVACLVDFSDDFVARAVQAAFGEAVSITLVRFQKGRPQPLRPTTRAASSPRCAPSPRSPTTGPPAWVRPTPAAASKSRSTCPASRKPARCPASTSCPPPSAPRSTPHRPTRRTRSTARSP